MRKKRCQIVKMSNEARVLKELRIQSKLSMFGAGRLIGRSDSYISHIENGRMNIPREEVLLRLLSIYNISMKDFRMKVKTYSKKTSKKEILQSMINQFSESEIDTIISRLANFKKAI